MYFITVLFHLSVKAKAHPQIGSGRFILLTVVKETSLKFKVVHIIAFSICLVTVLAASKKVL